MKALTSTDVSIHMNELGSVGGESHLLNVDHSEKPNAAYAVVTLRLGGFNMAIFPGERGAEVLAALTSAANDLAAVIAEKEQG